MTFSAEQIERELFNINTRIAAWKKKSAVLNRMDFAYNPDYKISDMFLSMFFHEYIKDLYADDLKVTFLLFPLDWKPFILSYLSNVALEKHKQKIQNSEISIKYIANWQHVSLIESESFTKINEKGKTILNEEMLVQCLQVSSIMSEKTCLIGFFGTEIPLSCNAQTTHMVEKISSKHLLALTKQLFPSEYSNADEDTKELIEKLIEKRLVAEISPALLELSYYSSNSLYEYISKILLNDEARRIVDAVERERRAEKNSDIVDLLETPPKKIKTLLHFHGVDSIKEWVEEMKEYLIDPPSGRTRKSYVDWSDSPAKILISGPPGCGKTSISEAIAHELEIPFITASYGQWQGAGTGHLGDLIAAMQKSFKDARTAAPSILFIDEIDSLSSRDVSVGKNQDWNTKVINAFLEELDGTKNNDGIIFIGATNYPERIDKALKRSGRLGLYFKIEPPSANDLAKIYKDLLFDSDALSFFIDNDDEFTKIYCERAKWNYQKFGNISLKLTGADVEAICSKINRLDKRTYKKNIKNTTTTEDYLSSILRDTDTPKKDLLPYATESAVLKEIASFGRTDCKETNRRIAHFIAGQIFIASIYDVNFKEASIMQSDNNKGISIIHSGPMLEETMYNAIMSLLGGSAAEEVFFEDKSALKLFDDSMRLATKYAVDVVYRHGFNNDRLSHIDIDEDGSVSSLSNTEAVNNILHHFYQSAYDLISNNASIVSHLAKELMENYSISYEKCQEIIENEGAMVYKNKKANKLPSFVNLLGVPKNVS